ncbi:hypothetical protein DPMN_060840 [Dreissena polymorpha]|uniref:Uncharacterized protein n=1 Tax=Dreissena polymorpha TaxID=45954 RepID=A0A9D4C6H2_DREPO|nr:hypothetical protein DPMN_060840 [Dreissena polymorpha]
MIFQAYQCTKLIHGHSLMKGYDSHVSPCKKELVILHKYHILPQYIVHYQPNAGEFKYTVGIQQVSHSATVHCPLSAECWEFKYTVGIQQVSHSATVHRPLSAECWRIQIHSRYSTSITFCHSTSSTISRMQENSKTQ